MKIEMIKMYLIDRNIALVALNSLKNTVWCHDIPHPGNCPEYRELHEKMQDIMEQIDVWEQHIKDARLYILTDDGNLVCDCQEDE